MHMNELISNKVTELIKAVDHFTGKFQQPIKLELFTTGAAVYVDSSVVF